MKSSAVSDKKGLDHARARQSMASDKDGRRDSRISSSKRSVAGDRRANKHEGESGGGSSRNHEPPPPLPMERLSQDTPGPNVTSWRQQVAKSRNMDDTSSSIGDFDDDSTETGRPSPQVRRKHSAQDLHPRTPEKKSASGHKGKDAHGSVNSNSSPGRTSVSIILDFELFNC